MLDRQYTEEHLISTVNTMMVNATHTHTSSQWGSTVFTGQGLRKLGNTIDSGTHTATKLRTLYHLKNYIYFKSRNSDGKRHRIFIKIFRHYTQ